MSTAEGAGPARVLALWSPDWPVTAAMRAERVPPYRPAAVIAANRVLVCSATARTHGVRRGLRRREAQARCPELVLLAHDADRDARLFEPVVAAVEELAPRVEVVRPGLVALAARGPVGYFGGEQQAAARLVDQVAARVDVECQIGLADGLFAAVLAARRGVSVEPGGTPAFLAPLGVEELDREPEVDRSELISLLRRLGLRSLGAFGALGAADVASRFGADAVLAHRLARGLDPRPPVRRHLREELAVEIELDPPVDRVDAAAFAARGLAERLHRELAGHGLSCTRLGVAAHMAGGEELLRIWRCAEPLTPAGTVDRVRWQLDAWLTQPPRRRSSATFGEAAVSDGEPASSLTRGGSGGVTRLRLTPEETVTAGALQLGLWGEVGEADERAGRALVRVQALLGPGGVVTAVLVGGRDPGERVRLVPWGDDRGVVAAAGAPELGAASPPDRSAPVAGAGGDPARATDGMIGVPAPGAGSSAAGGSERVISVGGSTLDAGPSTGPVRRGFALDADGPSGQVRPGPAPDAALSSGPAVRGDRPHLDASSSPRPAPDGAPPQRRSRRGRRSHSIRGSRAGRDPVPVWPGRLPAPSPAMVPRDPLPAELLDVAGRPVLLFASDLLGATPYRLTVDGGPSGDVAGWAGPWPLQQRWWIPGSTSGARLQVLLDDGVALLLLGRPGKWWVTGIYD
ncbi:DNA polymerase Y family protein [Pseudonocardia sp. H11422]|uniref:Y-family DNA polymerase n=1 Tax=Pseudonocardia sp. H11422 TaxID=2835866 RepID=UPI003977CD74